MANKGIREEIRKNGVRYWQVATALGVHPATFSCWLRHELTPERQAAVEEAVLLAVEMKAREAVKG